MQLDSSNALRVIADANIWGIQHAFSTFNKNNVQLEVLEQHEITANRIKNADILLVRSSTTINQSLLAGSPVRFVGTATIGDDHVDQTYLHGHHITFSSAAGSSTESVVEYMLASFYALEQQKAISFSTDKLGIIGVGRIGSLLQTACKNIGFETLLNDPPKQRQKPTKSFHELSYLLKHADILTLHTPLCQDGEFPTQHLLGKKELQQFQGKGIINAGRGACLDNSALLDWLNADTSRFAALDCWENEPHINLTLLNHPQVLIASPHIAGHSLDGKAANTLFIFRDLCDFLQVDMTWDIEDNLPNITQNFITTPVDNQTLAQQLYPIIQDHQAMKKAGEGESQSKDKAAINFSSWFKNYRRHYPIRRSWKKTLAAQKNMDIGRFF